MATINVRQLDDDVVERLERRAARNDRSQEGEARRGGGDGGPWIRERARAGRASRSGRDDTPRAAPIRFCRVADDGPTERRPSRYAAIRTCIPNARAIRITVAKLGVPFSDNAL